MGFWCPDNVDSPFYSPKFFKKYCTEAFTRAAAICHSRNKLFVVHACGKNKTLLKLVGDCKVDCLEGLTPSPIGDVDFKDARRLAEYTGFTINGGMSAMQTEIVEDKAEATLHEYVRGLFSSLPYPSHFIFASSCNTGPRTKWSNLLYFRAAARLYGKREPR
eukprot:NODE_1948_length_526_cov_518.343816_g1585_i0.p1 GENE.NODE_1948_length_526_cov_518.343816_g1585_i0~~NODE_1948_length_526_cov_518.343816_g1585_i0.p1  ORF type:complete len:162 (+),score=19.35 NODE_1948_length_526_cov_518.343816_g1585_i0:30-515(+)